MYYLFFLQIFPANVARSAEACSIYKAFFFEGGGQTLGGGGINWKAAQVACFNGKTRPRKKLELYFKQFKNKREKFFVH